MPTAHLSRCRVADIITFVWKKTRIVCYTEYEACQTSTRRTGVCLQLYTNANLGCYTQCEPVETCPEGTGCQPYDAPSCDEICQGYNCGTRQGCECGGTCEDGEECINNRCGGNYTCAEICGRAKWNAANMVNATVEIAIAVKPARITSAFRRESIATWFARVSNAAT